MFFHQRAEIQQSSIFCESISATRLGRRGERKWSEAERLSFVISGSNFVALKDILIHLNAPKYSTTEQDVSFHIQINYSPSNAHLCLAKPSEKITQIRTALPGAAITAPGHEVYSQATKLKHAHSLKCATKMPTCEISFFLMEACDPKQKTTVQCNPT